MDGTQYSTMNEEELFEERANMIALKRGIEQEFINEEGEVDWDALRASSEWAQYQALVEVVLSSPDVEDTLYHI